ncbi:Helicase MOV-10, partial [Entophlyctis sp. JEL0112]
MSAPATALDLEWYDQTGGKHLKQIGIATASQSAGGAVFTARLLVVKEHEGLRYRNRNAPDAALARVLGSATTLVLHNGSNDLRVLRMHGIDLPEKLLIRDTGAMFVNQTNASSPLSLIALCNALGIHVRADLLHNAGNDAFYTLMCYMKMSNPQKSPAAKVLKKASRPDSLKQTVRPKGGRLELDPENNIFIISAEQLPFFEAFRDTLHGTVSDVRLTKLDTLEKLKVCYRDFRSICDRGDKRLIASFEKFYEVAPVLPEKGSKIFGSPAKAVIYLLRQNLVGRQREKISFKTQAAKQPAGTALKFPHRVNFSDLQFLLRSVAPSTIDKGSVGVFPLSDKHLTMKFEIHNGHNSPRTLTKVVVEENPSDSQLSISANGKAVTHTVLRPNEIKEMTLNFVPRIPGYFMRRVVFLFQEFRFEALLKFRVTDGVENGTEADLQPAVNKPYRPKTMIIEEMLEKVELMKKAFPGEAPPRPSFEAFKHGLPNYVPPKDLRKDFELFHQSGKSPISAKPPDIRTFIEAKLDVKTFAERFHKLLYLEEFQMILDIREYDQDNETLTRTPGGYFKLKVPGLAENRPSVLYGDSMVVKLPNGLRYEGIVHKVELDGVLLKFNKNFHSEHYLDGMAVDVAFNFSRTCLKRSHRAIDILGFVPVQMACWTFPIPDFNFSEREIANSRLRFNRFLGYSKLNEFQKKAALNVLCQSGCQTPFVIFGPPGTGKTRTLVEVVKGIVANNPSARILVTAPSNAAVDMMILRLSDATPGGLEPSRMTRVNAFTRDKSSVSKGIERYSKYNSNAGYYEMPSCQRDLEKYSVVGATLYTVSSLYGMGAFDPIDDGTGLFTHIFVDEAGQATETEFWAGIAGAATVFLNRLQPSTIPPPDRARFNTIVGEFSNNGFRGRPKLPQLVVVGDPQQLGPIVRSDYAEACGYSVSYLERLLTSCEAYERLDYAAKGKTRYKHDQHIVKLVHNYRSHPAILKLYSKAFYDDDLLACAEGDPRLTNLNWLPNTREFPIVFHGVSGKDDREGNSPSWFNLDEVSIIIGYLKTLLLGEQPPFSVKKEQSGKFATKDGGIFGNAFMNMAKSSSVGITVNDIGIITPYRKQIDKIRLQLKKHGWENVMVGSVEEFQGGEKKVILLSTVRSSSQWVRRDQKFNIGFLCNPKRFNVSISRAKDLMIVVGNPEILCSDKHWNKLVRYCEANDACVGLAPPPTGIVFGQQYAQSAEDQLEAEEEETEVRDVK